MAEILNKYNSKAVRLTEELAGDLNAGEFSRNVPLPREELLVNRYGVSRSTLQRALSCLCERGTLLRDANKNLWLADQAAATGNPVAAQPKKTFRIGVQLGATYDQFFFQLMSGIQKYCDESGTNLARVQYDSYDEAVNFLHHVGEYDFDGILIVPFAGQEYINGIAGLLAGNYPVVAVDCGVQSLPVSVVACDHTGGCYQLTQRLIERHRREVYFFGSNEEIEAQLARYEGYKRAMSEAGWGARISTCTCRVPFLPNDTPLWNLEQPWHWPYRRALEWLPTLDYPVSIVAVNDYAACGIYQAARELNLAVGADIKLAGFGDLPLCRELVPPLTTISQNNVAVGYEAAHLLYNMLTRVKRHRVKKILPVKLLERASSL